MTAPSFTLFPAIDLKDGMIVRLRQGDMGSAHVYGAHPAAQAEAFAAAGCRWLHVVDLDGAIAGRSANGDAVAAILERVDMKVQLGGGLRDLPAIEAWLEHGVARVILGTVAASDPGLLREACAAFPGRILVGIDARSGRVAIAGWERQTERDMRDLAASAADAGAAAIIYTDIARDGMLEGPDIEGTTALAETVSLPVIASGGVRDLADILALKEAAATATGRIEGVVVGRALYDGRLDPGAALGRLAAA
ncbi:MAG: 1-(5-phosphoribosyl)-5-[(5-phosphoribosylamino)methylideneamino]imidazole-4-carboxamide isomerase [Rhodothalassiaceae bacterium]